MRDFTKLCTPAKIYFVIAIIAIIIGILNGFSLMVAFWKLLFAFIWTYILAWLCNKGYKTLSWFLVLLPYIIILLAMFGIYRFTHEQTQIMRTLQLQGAYGQEAMTVPTTQMPKKTK
jgi:hypothetical protein